MHAATPRMYFPNIDLKWSISNWSPLNAGSHLRQCCHGHRILYRSPFPFFCVSMIRYSASTVYKRRRFPGNTQNSARPGRWLLLFTVLAEWRIMTNRAYAKSNGDGLLYSIIFGSILCFCCTTEDILLSTGCTFLFLCYWATSEKLLAIHIK
jgi:hypothetical protein